MVNKILLILFLNVVLLSCSEGILNSLNKDMPVSDKKISFIDIVKSELNMM